jgi:hypothetical protein
MERRGAEPWPSFHLARWRAHRDLAALRQAGQFG